MQHPPKDDNTIDTNNISIVNPYLTKKPKRPRKSSTLEKSRSNLSSNQETARTTIGSQSPQKDQSNAMSASASNLSLPTFETLTTSASEPEDACAPEDKPNNENKFLVEPNAKFSYPLNKHASHANHTDLE